MPPRRRAAAAKTPIPDVIENNGLLTPGSTRTRGRALKKNDSGLTPASTVAGSDMEEDQKPEIKVKSEMVVEIPVKRSSRTSVAKKPKYTEDEEVDELEDKKPIIKDFATSRKRKALSDTDLSDLDAPITKKGTSSSNRQTATAKGKTRATPARSSRRKVKSEDNPDIVPDSQEEDNFTASEEEEAYAEFEGDDDELDFVPRTTKTAGKRAPARAASKKATDKMKGKAVAQGNNEDEIEEEMMKAAIAESLKTMEQPRAGPSKPAARNKEAEKRARAAERRMGMQVDSDSDDSSFKFESDGQDDDPDADADFDDEDDEDVKPSGSKKKVSVANRSNGRTMDLAGLRKKRAEDNKRRKEAAEPLMKIKREMMKKLKRKLTWAEINSVALNYHHPELQNVWGDLKAGISRAAPTTMEAHPSLKLTLLPFQKESLFWMKQQEAGPWKGGMLADEMGMGKTIQTIALLLSEPRRKPSLVVAPVVALMQWKHEIEKNAEGFTVCLWHGQGRLKADDLKKFDVVMVSYGTLEAAFRKQQKGFKRGDAMIKEKSPMHAVKWHRVVLDEAHNIKERSTNAAKAAFALDSSYRWCLSGTPLQNRVGELYSLVRFLGGDPFAFYYCKRCPCKSLHWQFGNKRNCDDCGHSPMQHTCYWNNEILTPIQKYGMQGPGSDAFKKLKILLDRCMLRRTKIERADDLGLPPRTITVRRGYFSPEERELYMSLFSETRRQFSTYIAEGTILNNYSNVFSLITRMRQMACHPDLVLRSKTSKYVQTEEEAVCRLCHDTAEDAIVSKCNHLFDRECITQYMLGHEETAVPVCPVCHIELTIDLQAEAVESGEEKKLKKQGILGRLDLSNWRSSTKLEMLVDELCELRDKDCNIKSLVFSQFVSMLDLAAFRLQRAGFNICRLEGGMTPQARDATIQHFMKNPQVTVFLISLKAGGVALNLTEASQVFLLDSWWNPSVEYQSMDRIHRLGQHRPVQVTKLVVEDSIEAKILQLQDKKLAMTQAALATDPDSALGKLTEEDMQFLFRL